MFPSAIIVTLFIIQLTNMHFVAGITLKYEELVDIGGSCKPLDTCNEDRLANTADSLSNENHCTCNGICSKFGTCCMDAGNNRDTLTPYPMPVCRWMEAKPGNPEFYTGFYMVDRCWTGDEFESVWKDPCETDSLGDDILPMAPVTSLLTSMTYKNYFCFRCYETTSDFAYWNLVISGRYDGPENVTKYFANDDYNFMYNQWDRTWIAFVGRNSINVPVRFRFETPDRIRSLGIECNPYVISTCSESWTDDEIREKCDAYQAIVWFLGTNGTLSTYRNAHCALCNNETLENKLCHNPLSWLPPREDPYDFSHTVDVNRYDGELLVPVEPLCDDVWDPYGKVCRKISCPNPNNEVKDDMCKPRENSYGQPFYGPFNGFQQEFHQEYVDY